MLKELFYKCAYRSDYKNIGHDVSYAFDEDIENKTLSIFWQGSNGITDWVRNFLFTSDCYGLFKCHKGFLTAYMEARNLILDKVYEKDENGDFKWLKIIVVGYSHGASLCQIAIQDIWYHRQDIKDCIIGYAFESPRALKVKKKYRFMWNGLKVIRNGGDLITHLPPAIFGYHHLGTMVKIKGDTKLVENKMPKCIKYHYPQCVLDGLEKYENEVKQNGR